MHPSVTRSGGRGELGLSAREEEHKIQERTTAMKLSSGGTRWARWGLLAATFGMGGSLLFTSWSSYRSVIGASATLSEAQGEALIHSIAFLVRRDAPPPQAAELEAALEEQASVGLRYVAIFDAAGQKLAEAGTPLGDRPIDPIADRHGEPRALLDLGGRVRLIAGPPPLSSRERDPGETAGRRERPTIAIEFEPLLARQLSGEAARALSFGAAAAAGLMIVALLFSRELGKRESAERRFEEQRRLAALGEMSSVLAHELRNPLASLKGHAQLLAERLPEASPERRKADRIVLEAQRLEALTADLLDFSRSGPIDRRETDPAALLRTVADSLDASRIALVLEAAPHRWRLDPERMRQVLTNLLQNALQAAPAPAPTEARIASEGGVLVFTVRDRGPGIPEGEAERIFEPFYTTRVNGTGLGLAVAQRIVEMHGGTIAAANHPEGGAVFRVAIPGS
jgi:two-component system sensor histidine kinase HydH